MPEELKALHPRNPRTITDDRLASLGVSLEELGDLSGVIYNRRTKRLCGGNQRSKHFSAREAAIEITHTFETPDAQGTTAIGFVHSGGFRYSYRVVDWDEARENAAMIRANVSAGEFDDAQLTQLLSEISQADALKLTGFDEEQLKKLLREQTPRQTADAPSQNEQAAKLQRRWKVKRGQLWQLGDHLLLCGDCTDEANISRLLGADRAQLCLTDPPYGIGEDYDEHKDTPEELDKLVSAFLPLAQKYADVVVLTPGNKHQWKYPPPTWALCWYSPAGQGCGPWGFICWHVVYCYGKDPYLSNGLGSRPDAFEFNAPKDVAAGHPCAKPLELWQTFLERCSTSQGDIVLEMFSGSGTTIIACENMKRRCRAIERSPKYCAVALQRYADATNKRPICISAT